MIDFLSNHLQNVIEQKDLITTHLHEPFVGKPLAIDSSHHRYHTNLPNNLRSILSLFFSLKYYSKSPLPTY